MQLGTLQPSKRLISLTPLIDVVFILLVFFMLASSYLDWHSIGLSISSGKGAANSSQRAILISLGADGSLAVGSQLVGRSELVPLIGGRLAEVIAVVEIELGRRHDHFAPGLFDTERELDCFTGLQPQAEDVRPHLAERSVP